MSAKELKLGWTVSETIGVAIVNPRGVNSMKAIPRFNFKNEQGGIDIRRYSIEITGSVEGAASAFAKAILDRTTNRNQNEHWTYCDIIYVNYDGGVYRLHLNEDGDGLIDPDIWSAFKKHVEKICNDLKAFL